MNSNNLKVNEVSKVKDRRAIILKKCAARAAVQYALKTGKLEKSAACERCGRLGKTEFHHSMGHAKGFQLVGFWLCRPCHQLEEKRKKPEQLELFPEPVIKRDFIWN